MDQKLLMRYITGETTPEERAGMAEWLDADPENMREFLAFRKLYDITLWQYGTSTAKINKQPKTEFVVVFLGVRYFKPSQPGNEPVVLQTIYVPAGQRAQLTLADNTKVWLNAKTTLTFPNHFSASSRNVALDGEGYFEVAGNKKQPFIVKTEKYDIRVLGTQFNVMAYAGKPIFETSLIEGSIELLNPGGVGDVVLLPNERVFLKDNQLVRGSISNFNNFLWKDGLISFDNELFTEMASKLELYFDLKINLTNDKILKNRYTGKFRTKDGVEHILRVLQLSNQFRFKINDKLNIVTIE
jgi:transmembrane sensor